MNGLGPAVIVVSGGVMSRVKLCVAGVGSTFPAASVARTLNVWSPSASTPGENGDAQVAYWPSSSLHSNVEPSSVDVKRNGLGPDVIVVSGGVVSTVKARDAAPTLPARR